MTAELGQILHNNPVGVPASPLVDAIVTAIRSDIARAYWNVNQKSWKGAGHADIGGGVDPWSDEWAALSYDTGIPGIEWRGYYNWGGSPDDPDWDQAQADAPNFSFEGVEVRWYKRFGRSLNVNVMWPAEKWERWHQRCVQTIDAWESATLHDSGRDYHDPTPYPDPSGAVSLDPEPADLRFLELQDRIQTLEAQRNLMACVCIDVADGKDPRVKPDDWRYCHDLEWIVKLGRHALTAPTKFRLHDDDED